MDVKIETVGPCKKKVRIELPAAKVDAEFEKNYRELADSVVIPGFRRGKAPRRLMEKRFGVQVKDQVKANLLTETLQQAFEGNDLHPIGDPNLDIETIDVKPQSPLVLEFEVEVRPEFELKEYSGVEVDRHEVAVDEREVEAALHDLAERHSEEVTVGADETVARGDRVLVDWTTTPAEDPHHHGHGHHHEPHTEENLILAVLTEAQEKNQKGPALYDSTAFVGKKRGDTVSGKFPDEQHGDHSHPGPRWDAKIKEIKRYQLPKIDDELAKSMDCATLEELTGKIRDELRRRAEDEEDHAVERRIVEKLVDLHEIEFPESFMEHALRDVQERRRFALKDEGLATAEIEKAIHSHHEEDAESLKRELKASLILDKIAEEVGINVTEDEVDERIQKIAHRNRRWPNEIRSQLESEGELDNLRRALSLEKTRVHLRQNAKVATKPAATDEAPANGGDHKKKKTGE